MWMVLDYDTLMGKLRDLWKQAADGYIDADAAVDEAIEIIEEEDKRNGIILEDVCSIESV